MANNANFNRNSLRGAIYSSEGVQFLSSCMEMSRKVQSENPLKLSGAGKRFIQNEVERSGTEF